MSMQNHLTEFPDFIMDVQIPERYGFEDWSWHNDSCPSFGSEFHGLKVWVDYRDVSKREFPTLEFLRFTLVRIDENHGETPVMSSNDWTDILTAMKAEIEPEEVTPKQKTINRLCKELRHKVEQSGDQILITAIRTINDAELSRLRDVLTMTKTKDEAIAVLTGVVELK